MMPFAEIGTLHTRLMRQKYHTENDSIKHLIIYFDPTMKGKIQVDHTSKSIIFLFATFSNLYLSIHTFMPSWFTYTVRHNLLRTFPTLQTYMQNSISLGFREADGDTLKALKVIVFPWLCSLACTSHNTIRSAFDYSMPINSILQGLVSPVSSHR